MRVLVPCLLAAAPALAEAPRLIQPIACTLGQDCFIQQFPDQDPGSDARDFRCGPQTYDTHKGTDFALPSRAAQAAGVPVLAAAAGTVTGVRNSMPDILQSAPDAPDVSGRECGNGLVLDHGNGWQTQYCHLARGSISVATGDTVDAGTPLGLVGLSGRTEFPHLHISVRHNGKTIDPFDPTDAPGCTIDPAQDLWEPDLPTPQGGIIAAGFADAIPAYSAIKDGTAHRETLPNTAPNFVLWAYVHGGRAGDTMTLSISGIYDQTITLDRTQAQLFRAGGRKTPPDGWPPGAYTGTVTLMRDGEIIAERATNITLTGP